VDDVVATSTKLRTVKNDTKDIWTEDEVAPGAEFDDVDDPRQQPQSVISPLIISISSIVCFLFYYMVAQNLSLAFLTLSRRALGRAHLILMAE